MVEDSMLITIDGPAGVVAAATVAAEEIDALDDVRVRERGFDLERTRAFPGQVRALLDAGEHERAARALHAGLAGLLRAHAWALLRPASATAGHRTALDRIAVAMQGLVEAYGERALDARGDERDLPGLLPPRRRLGLRRRRA